MTITLVLPCFNEEELIKKTVYSCAAWMEEKGGSGEIIIVDDGSRDRSPAILARLAVENPRVRIVTHMENQGYGAAVRSGCDRARMELIAFMDSDGQFDVRDLEHLLLWCASQPSPQSFDRLRTGFSSFNEKGRTSEQKFCLVAGRRLRRADSMMRNLYGKLLGILTWVLFGLWVRDINCGMKVFRTDVWPVIRPVYGTEKMFNTEIFLRLKRAGLPWKQVDVRHFPRQGGRPTGASVKVIGRMFKELWNLRRHLSLIAAAQSNYCASNLRILDPKVLEESDAQLGSPEAVRSR